VIKLARRIAESVFLLPDALEQLVNMWTVLQETRDRLNRIERSLALDARVSAGEQLRVVAASDLEALEEAVDKAVSSGDVGDMPGLIQVAKRVYESSVQVQMSGDLRQAAGIDDAEIVEKKGN
jgi:hypothetical protein